MEVLNRKPRRSGGVFVLYLAELKKLLHKKFVIIYFAVLILSVVGCAVYLSLNSGLIDDFAESGDWIENMRATVRSYIDFLSGGGITTTENYSSILAQVMTYSYYLEHNIRPFGTHSASYTVIFSNYLYIVILVFSIIVAVKIITDEYGEKTIKGLLTIPLSRWKILLTKYLVIVSFAFATSLIVFVSSILFGWIFFGFDAFTTPYVCFFDGKLLIINVLLRALLQVFYNILSVVFCASVAVLLGVITKNGIASCVIGISLYALGYVADFFVADAPWLKFLPFLNMDFSGYILGTVNYGASAGMTALILTMYSVPIVAASFVAFNRQDITI